MANDPRVNALIELAERISSLAERVERLESLEYSTVAFPAGLGVICDTIFAAPSSTFTCSSIPQTAKHLWIIYSLKVTASTDHEIGIQFNGDTLSDYAGYQRGEFAGPSDADNFAAALLSSTYISIGEAAGPLSSSDEFSAGFVFIPDYTDIDDFTTVVDGDFFRRDLATDRNELKGGGGIWQTSAAIFSFRIFQPSGVTFATGSRITVYGV